MRLLILALILCVSLRAQILQAIIGAVAHNAVVYTQWVTSLTGGTLRNDVDGPVGARVTVGATPLVVTQVGRWCAGTSLSGHVFYIYDSPTHVVASVTINTIGCTVGQFVYASLSYTLAAGATYYMGTYENNGGDVWYDNNTSLTVNPVMASFSAAYADSGGAMWTDTGATGTMFVGVDVKF
jgi:hypothetical protein